MYNNVFTANSVDFVKLVREGNNKVQVTVPS